MKERHTQNPISSTYNSGPCFRIFLLFGSDISLFQKRLQNRRLLIFYILQQVPVAPAYAQQHCHSLPCVPQCISLQGIFLRTSLLCPPIHRRILSAASPEIYVFSEIAAISLLSKPSKKIMQQKKNPWLPQPRVFLILVELRGVEPLSEKKSTGVSTGVAYLQDSPPARPVSWPTVR